MFFSQDFRISLTSLGTNIFVSNKGFLSLLQDVAEMHSASINYGITNIEKTKHSWAILNWKVQFISRPKYGETITIKTWARNYTKLFCYRDFEIYNSNGDLIAIASSKWVLIDIEKHKIARLEEDVMKLYSPEEKSVFNTAEIEKISEPENYSNTINYVIRKSDIDVNNHVNNLCYVDIALEAFPGNTNEFNSCTEFEIMYKHQIRIEDMIKVSYSFENNENYVVIKSDEGTNLHAIIRFK